MNKERLDIKWKAYRRQVPLPNGFADQVMAHIETQASAKRFDPLVQWNTLPGCLMRWSLALGLLLLGLFRLSFITASLLVP